jgi:cation transport ATPase
MRCSEDKHFSSISTDRIMRAVQQQKQITRQMEDIRTQQQSRMAQMRPVGFPLVAMLFFTLGSIPLLLLALAIVQPDWLASLLSSLSMGIYALFVLLQYMQEALTLMTGNSRLLAIVALALVVMMGMWLRLMRPPREA